MTLSLLQSLLTVEFLNDLFLVLFFFTLYINNISNCSSYDQRLVLDDTSFILQYKTEMDWMLKLMNNVNNWMNVDKLTLNFSKSHIL